MGGQAVSLRSCTAIVLEEPMTKDQAIEVLIAHAERCPEPEPRERGYPEDIRDDYNEWRERQAKVNEAVGVLTSRPSETDRYRAHDSSERPHRSALRLPVPLGGQLVRSALYVIADSSADQE